MPIRLPVYAFFAFLFFVLAGYSYFPLGNEDSHMQLLYALATEGRFELPFRTWDMAVVDGKFYSNKPPGYPLVLWPVSEGILVLGGSPEAIINRLYFFARMLNAVFSAGSVTFVFLYLSTFPLSTRSQLFGALAAGFGTLLPGYTAYATSAPLCVFLTLGALWLVRRRELDPGSGAWGLALAGGMLSLAFVADYKTAAFSLPLALVAAGRLLRSGPGALGIGALFAALPLAALAYYNHQVFGEVLVFSYEHYSPPDYVPWEGLGKAFSPTYISEALWGLTFGTARGMLPLSPVVGLGVVGLWVAMRTGARVAALPAVMALSGLAVLSCYVYWFGGHTVGYRHLLIGAVLMAMLSAFALEAARSRWAALPSCFAILILSVGLSVAAWRIQQDPVLLDATWKDDEGRVQSDFFSDLLWPCLTEEGRCPLERIKPASPNPGASG